MPTPHHSYFIPPRPSDEPIPTGGSFRRYGQGGGRTGPPTETSQRPHRTKTRETFVFIVYGVHVLRASTRSDPKDGCGSGGPDDPRGVSVCITTPVPDGYPVVLNSSGVLDPPPWSPTSHPSQGSLKAPRWVYSGGSAGPRTTRAIGTLEPGHGGGRGDGTQRSEERSRATVPENPPRSDGDPTGTKRTTLGRPDPSPTPPRPGRGGSQTK